jgi:hypothetical protein
MTCARNMPFVLLITVLAAACPAQACIPPERPFLPGSREDMRTHADLILRRITQTELCVSAHKLATVILDATAWKEGYNGPPHHCGLGGGVDFRQDLSRVDRVPVGHRESREAPADRRAHFHRPDGGNPAVDRENPRDGGGRGDLDRDERRPGHPQLCPGKRGKGETHEGGAAPEPPAPPAPLG